MAAAATATATSLYKYTYTLGRSLYVPITSRCNSIPLPVTRGPGFVLPKSVAESLLHVRHAEVPNYSVGFDYSNDWLHNNEEEGGCDDDGRVEVPPYNLPLVNSLYEFHYDDIPRHLQRRREIFGTNRNTNPINEDKDDVQYAVVLDDNLQPSISTLVQEVTSRLVSSSEELASYNQVVIAGEGEPTLRMDALLAVARCVQSYNNNNNKQHQHRQQHLSKNNKHDDDTKPIYVRVVTNGLCYGIPNLGYSPYNKERDGVLIPMHRHVILRDMIEAGVSRLSVALNTSNRHEYDVLMEPSCHTGGGSSSSSSVAASEPKLFLPGVAHDIVCEFIMETTKLGMDVEITGIDRPDVDKLEMERLARLLMSVRPRNDQRSRNIRWRRYFE